MGKRIASCCIAILLVISMLQPFALYADAAPIASGECGENLTWELDDKGLLTISGTGAMYDFDYRGGYWEDVFGGLISKVVISEGVTSIGKSAFHNCDTLVDAIIPDSVTSIGEFAFYSCGSLKNVQMPKEISYIGRFAFHDCGQLTNIIIPTGITEIPQVSFTYCRGLNNVTIPDGVQVIEYGAFQACTELMRVVIPQSVKTIDEAAFAFCSNIRDVYYSGTEEQWNAISIGEFNEELMQATIHFNSTDDTEDIIKFSITTDHTTLSIRKNNKILFGAGLFSNGVQVGDVSGITFQIEDSSVVEVSASFFKDNYLYASFIGLKEGTTNVLFSDSKSGAVATISVTVYSDGYLCYTLSSVPTKKIEKYPTNFYNVNGLYIDSYTYTVNADKSATMSFDVYNSNYTYGAVEVYDVNGNLKNAVLIDKMSSGMTSMKEVLWNDVVYLVGDICDRDLLSYRQESGFSKKTPITITIPKNGYIKICNDPENSFIVGLVNSVDLLLSLADFMGEVKKYDVNSTYFSEKLTTKLVNEKIFAECVKDGSKFPKKLWSNVGKATLSSPTALATSCEVLVQNISDLELEDVIIETAMDFGVDVGEEAFTYFAGPFGAALKAIFAIGKMENILVQHAHMTQSAGIGSIYIQNQGGGVLGSQQITVKSESGFETDTALRVFSVSIDPDLLSKIEESNPELFEALSKNLSYTYDISLIKNGDETQPSGKIAVCIPIPEAWRVPMPNDLKESIYAGMFKIYRLEEDGSTTEMPIDVKDGCFVFETDHFSLYSLVKYDVDNTSNIEKRVVDRWLLFSIVIVIIGGSILMAFCVANSKKKRHT